VGKQESSLSSTWKYKEKELRNSKAKEALTINCGFGVKVLVRLIWNLTQVIKTIDQKVNFKKFNKILI